MVNRDFLRNLGIQYPIIQAPMGGGPGTPELGAAVCESGGLGSLAAAYLDPGAIANTIHRLRELTGKPFNVNLFAGGYEENRQVESPPMLAILDEVHQQLGLPSPTLPAPQPDPFEEQLQVILEERPAIFSFTFGVPTPHAMRRLKERDIFLIGTATTVQEGLLLEESGVDAVVAQGAEAGAHRGTFAGSFEDSMIPTLELVRAIRQRTSLPVIASGGLMDGRDIAEALAQGASAVQLGTAFLACQESGISPSYKAALLGARTDTTVITRAFSGRPARGLRNAFITRMEGNDIVLTFPTQNTLTRAMRGAAAKLGNPDVQSLWAGQGVTRTRALPAAELVRCLLEEMKQAGVAL